MPAQARACLHAMLVRVIEAHPDRLGRAHHCQLHLIGVKHWAKLLLPTRQRIREELQSRVLRILRCWGEGYRRLKGGGFSRLIGAGPPRDVTRRCQCTIWITAIKYLFTSQLFSRCTLHMAGIIYALKMILKKYVMLKFIKVTETHEFMK